MDILPEKTDLLKEAIPENERESLYSKADILYFLLDGDLRILSCNVTAEEKLGYEKRQIQGKKFLDFIPKLDQAETEKILQLLLRKGYIKNRLTSLEDYRKRAIEVEINGLTAGGETSDRLVRLFVKDISTFMRHHRLCRLADRWLRFLSSGPKEKEAIRFFLREIWESRLSTGLGIFIEDAKGQVYTLGSWGSLGTNSENTFSEQPQWHPKKWAKVCTAMQRVKGSHQSEQGTLWIDSLSDAVVELDPFDEKENLLSLSDYESLAIFPLKTPSYFGFLVLTHTAYARWEEEEIGFLETLISGFSLVDQEKREAGLEGSVSIHAIPFIGVVSVKEGLIRNANGWMENLLKVPLHAMIHQPIRSWIDPMSYETLDRWEERGASERGMCSGEIVWVDHEGERHLLDCVIHFLDDESQVWYLSQKEVMDVTQQEEARKSLQLESIGTLTDGIVHDFNNVLSNLMGYSSLLSEEVPKDSPYYEDILQIAKTSEKASELIDRLMAFTRGQSKTVDDLNLNAVITELAGILSRTFNKKIVIQAELEPELRCIRGDRAEIEQALLQVAFHARDTMPMGGKLRFQTRNMTLSENAARHQPGALPGDYVQIIISDTGEGLTAQSKQRLFDPEYASKKIPGRGYGLFLVQDIVQRHGGYISVFSDMTKGTIIKIHFPAVVKKRVKEETASGSGHEQRRLDEGLLVIEPDAVTREELRRLYQQTQAPGGVVETLEEALSFLKKEKERIGTVILPLMIPGIEFQKAVSALRRIHPAVRLVLALNSGEEELLDTALKKQVAGWIQKPYQSKHLFQHLRR